MDIRTRETYNEQGRRYAQKWLGKPMPAETATVVLALFRPDRSTIDVGCGSGRDVAWMHEQGMPAVGVEVSQTLLAVAREAFPSLSFRADSLPLLASTTERFDQILCRNVLMHLQANDQVRAVRRLVELLELDGVMVLTWRMDTLSGDARDVDGRLYAHVDPTRIEEAVEQAGAQVLSKATAASGSSGKTLAVWGISRPR